LLAASELEAALKEKEQYQEILAQQAGNAVDLEKMTNERNALEEQLQQALN
jgi:hypothetical protein